MDVNAEDILKGMMNNPDGILDVMRTSINEAKQKMGEISVEIQSRTKNSPLSDFTLTELLLMLIQLTLSSQMMLEAFDELEDLV